MQIVWGEWSGCYGGVVWGLGDEGLEVQNLLFGGGVGGVWGWFVIEGGVWEDF